MSSESEYKKLAISEKDRQAAPNRGALILAVENREALILMVEKRGALILSEENESPGSGLNI